MNTFNIQFAKTFREHADSFILLAGTIAAVCIILL